MGMLDEPCAPTSHVLVSGTSAGLGQSYSACECGRRYPLQISRSILSRLLYRYVKLCQNNHGSNFDQDIREAISPRTPAIACELSCLGVVPVGTPVLHKPTRYVECGSGLMVELGNYMLRVMAQAQGIGLAANQIGLPIRVLCHDMHSVVTDVLINPLILQRSGLVTLSEGCLSLRIDGAYAATPRSRRVVVAACAPTGEEVIISAGGRLARILQHEIDHLDGIEYVQRLRGADKLRVYDLMRERKVDIDLMPPLFDHK